MNKKKNVAMYARVGNHDQLVDPVDFILAQAMRGEIQTLVVGTLERVCADPERRQPPLPLKRNPPPTADLSLIV